MLETFLNDTIYKVKAKVTLYYGLLEEWDKEAVSRATQVPCLCHGDTRPTYWRVEQESVAELAVTIKVIAVNRWNIH